MSVTLKKLLGEGSAGLDESMGFDTLYDVLKQVITELNALQVQYNQLRADYNTEHATDTTATAVATTLVLE
jgi:hypothetical protein